MVLGENGKNENGKHKKESCEKFKMKEKEYFSKLSSLIVVETCSTCIRLNNKFQV